MALIWNSSPPDCPIAPTKALDGASRLAIAQEHRAALSRLVQTLPQQPAQPNEDEKTCSTAPMSFTKGLPHDAYGLVEPQQYRTFTAQLWRPLPQMAHHAQAVGHRFDLSGPDVSSFNLPAAPHIGSSEACAEIALLYVMALLRDSDVQALEAGTQPLPYCYPALHPNHGQPVTAAAMVSELRKLPWIDADARPDGANGPLSQEEKYRRATLWEDQDPQKGLTLRVLARGISPGARKGPHISQFLLLGTARHRHVLPHDQQYDIRSGQVSLGAQRVDQRIEEPTPQRDYLSDWNAWLDAQTSVTQHVTPSQTGRQCFISQPRHLANLAHECQPYQPFVLAAEILRAQGLRPSIDAPLHMLLADVANRAHRAAYRQKFQIHRRARPEVLAARLTQTYHGLTGAMSPTVVARFTDMLEELGADHPDDISRPGVLLSWISARNDVNNAQAGVAIAGHDIRHANFLLPQAFPGGAPGSPSYGCATAAAAAACATVLKAVFDGAMPLPEALGTATYLHAHPDAATLVDWTGPQDDFGHATLADELDKLAENLSCGRGFAGVAHRSDLVESLRLGERVAAAVLQDHILSYEGPVALTLTDIDHRQIIIDSCFGGVDCNGTVSLGPKLTVTGMTECEWWLGTPPDMSCDEGVMRAVSAQILQFSAAQ
ncbi:hypothetical protein BFP70_03520 [Thioclava sp. SK-1]|uniref:hypothetical protein n=1 Tax=Thioclava sp. SK-1 TaxID=1889770 RepID=UPI0008249691|nr:hypothetical protein [Thioclava sp. SK-1]OCX66908.1 hypothetical protein BFP70_03520 [Thioclava sp. SK-1]